MAEHSGISWTDHTWSPWTGCTKISPACDGCYAAHMMDTRMGRVEWGEPGVGEGTRSLMSEAYWRKPLAWNRAAEKAGERLWVFPSLCDPFDTAVPPEWRHRFVRLMEATPHIVWLLLTKRIGNVPKLTDPARGELLLPPNHALLSTLANQPEADRDLPKLFEAAAFTRPLFTGISAEPLLSGLDIVWALSRNPIEIASGIQRRGHFSPGLETIRPLGWVISGGETDQGGHKARPSHPDWFRGLRDQCAVAGTPFHFKQHGEWLGYGAAALPDASGNLGLPCGPRDDYDFPDGERVFRVGKKASGRVLDGQIHDERPTVQ